MQTLGLPERAICLRCGSPYVYFIVGGGNYLAYRCADCLAYPVDPEDAFRSKSVPAGSDEKAPRRVESQAR